jgi:peptide/nickel transport system substrate-binding protein
MSPSSYWDRAYRRTFTRRRVLRGGLAVGAAGGLLAAGCASQSTTPATGPAPAGAPTAASGAAAPAASPAAAQPKYGGILRTGSNSKPPHADVHQTTQSTTFTFGPGMAYNRLLRYKTGPDVKLPSYIPVPDLAEKWEQAEELVYLFPLNRGVKFHNLPPVNGRELVAEDVVKSYERQLAERVNAGSLAGLARVEAPEKYLVRITLERPNADFLVNIADSRCKVIPIETVAVNGDLKDGPIIGTSAWIMEKNDPNTETTFKRNPDYFRKGLPYLDGVQWIRTPDYGTFVQGMKAKSFEFMPTGLTKADVDSLKDNDPKVQVNQSLGWGGREMGLKADRPPFNDKRVRQAVSKAIDRQAILDTVYFGSGWLAPPMALPAADWAVPQDELKATYRRDLDGARRLLREANAENLDIELIVSNQGEDYIATAELVSAQLKEVGIATRIRLVDPTIYLQAIQTRGEYLMYLGSISPQTSANGDLYRRHHSTASLNTFKLNDPKLDELIDRQSVMTKDPEGRKRVLLEIQRFLLDQAYLLTLASPASYSVAQSYVKELYPLSIVSDENLHYEYAWFDK